MDEDVIIPCIFCSIAGWILGLAIGTSCNEITELSNGCIVHDSNVYCVEEAK